MKNIKQLLILDRKLTIKHIISINKVIPVQDIISPQKTTFEIKNTDNILLGDLVVLKSNNKVEFIGIIQDIEVEKSTNISTYPLISITDIDCVMGNINGNVFSWIKDVFEYNLVKTLTDSETSNQIDDLLALPFVFKDNTNEKTLQLEVKNGNFYDVLIDIFKKTGVYLTFDLQYNNGKVSNILVNVNVASEENKTTLRYDNPIIIEKPVIENSQYQGVNKVIFVPSNDNKTASAKYIYVFYLLDDNTITNNPKGTETGKRINGVRQSIIEYSEDDYTKGLQKIAEENMLGNTLDHQITIKVLNNESFNVELYDKVKYIDKNKLYETYVTRIENYNNVYKILKLGILRTTLTDKIKNLEKLLNKKSFGVVSGGSGGGSGSSVDVYDGVDSTSKTTALSANQGRILNEKISSKADLSQIPDVSQFITKFVSDLENYYLKSQTYTQEEINQRISAIPKFSIQVVSELPTENISDTTLYLYKINTSGNDTYIEYIYVNGVWEKLGTPVIDLTGYVKSEDFNKLVLNTTYIQNTSGGFKAGQPTTASSTSDVSTGGAIGQYASATHGGAIGRNAQTLEGGAVGDGAKSGLGFAGGDGANAGYSPTSDRIQLGKGTNNTNKTLQVYDDNIYNANTHTLTVKNIELDGEDIKDKIGAGGTKIIFREWT